MLFISSGEHELFIDPTNGGRVVSWQIAGVDVLAPVEEEPIEGGWYLMAPWVGRLRDQSVTFDSHTFRQAINFREWAIHGTLPFAECRVLAHSDREIVISHQTDKRWPIPAMVTLAWEVHEWGVETRASVSTTEGSFPAAVGWHPWFRRNLALGDTPVGRSAVYGFDASAQFVTDEKFIVTGETVDVGVSPFDDSFVVPDGKAHITWPGFRRIDIAADVKFMHLYEANEFVCIEPETAPPNGVNLLGSGYGHIVSPGKPLTAQAEWRVSEHSGLN